MGKEYMSELICVTCSTTGHVTWDSIGEGRRALDQSPHIQLNPDNPARFTCLKCGAEQGLK